VGHRGGIRRGRLAPDHGSRLFVLAGLCEIGGGATAAHGGSVPLGAATLVLYGVVPTYQPAHFGRVYAHSV
jgi:drug/metabolite transporter superfamily protein YnfA